MKCVGPGLNGKKWIPLSRLIACGLLIWLIALEANGQSKSFVTGQVLDAHTLEPIPFVTIVLKEHNLGLYANDAGDFRFMHRPAFGRDSLILSCIGYQRMAISFAMLKRESRNVIKLTPNIYETVRVEIVAGRKTLSSQQIVDRAIRRIRKNYPLNKHDFIGYYRDYQRRLEKYYNLNEGIIYTQDYGFNKHSPENHHLLLSYQENQAFERLDMSPYYDTTLHTDIQSTDKFIQNADLPDRGGNELFVLLIHDAVRNFKIRSFSMVEIMARDFVKNHLFEEPLIIYNGALRLYRINFVARSSLIKDSLQLSGSIYIQPEDYSIHKLEYVSHYMKNGLPSKKMFELVLEYGYQPRLDGKMGLRYISFNNIFKVVDVEDTTFFRFVDAYWDPEDIHRKELVIKFNHFIDTTSCTAIENYDLFLDDKRLKIASIRVEGKGVRIKMKRSVFDQENVRFLVHQLKDEEGRILNHKKYLEFYQFRELFAQEYVSGRNFHDPCYVKDVPLNRNCIHLDSSMLERYWMNTPMQQN